LIDIVCLQTEQSHLQPAQATDSKLQLKLPSKDDDSHKSSSRSQRQRQLSSRLSQRPQPKADTHQLLQLESMFRQQQKESDLCQKRVSKLESQVSSLYKHQATFQNIPSYLLNAKTDEEFTEFIQIQLQAFASKMP
jgi:hypothetical protein